MKIHIKYLKPWPFLRSTHAIVLYPFVCLRDDPKTNPRYESLMAHEMTHVAQCEERMTKYPKLLKWIGWLEYYVIVLYQYARYGYWNSPIEVAARAAEQEYLDNHS